ncbi:MAG TPA: inorganic phosphate transporter [Candidatus Acidoferrales bacterium]|nr:inorganic phosphate transporter [Candidatus Acidoferrales bacterium]
MKALLIFAVGLLSLANGANDNFKGVATLWGSGLSTYKQAIAWATGFTFLGSLAAIWFGSALAAKFSGAQLVDTAIVGHFPFLAAVALGAGATVLLAARLGMPISTTHSITGALIGASTAAAGFSHVRFSALGRGVILPLLFSPIIALVLTVGVLLVVSHLGWHAGKRDCICVDEPKAFALAAINSPMAAAVISPPLLRWAPAADCETGAEIARLNLGDSVHWFSGAAISFARGLNDTPKIVAILLVAAAVSPQLNYLFVGMGIAVGGAFGAVRVAQTMSRKITPMSTSEAVTANLVAAALVTLASPLGLPVSTTHVTSGGIFGISLLRRHEADWSKVRDILLSWVATLPLGAILALVIYKLLLMWWS